MYVKIKQISPFPLELLVLEETISFNFLHQLKDDMRELELDYSFLHLCITLH